MTPPNGTEHRAIVDDLPAPAPPLRGFRARVAIVMRRLAALWKRWTERGRQKFKRSM
jgi:hypothetical protein